MLGVGGGAIDFEDRFVLGRKRKTPSREHLMRAGDAELLPDRLAEAILPGARERSDLRFDLAHQRGRGRFRMEAEMESRRVTLAEREVVIEQLALESALQRILN